MEAKSLFYALFVFFSSEFADFDDADIHGVRGLSFSGSEEGLIGLMSGFGVLLGDFISMLPLGLEGDGLLIPIVNGGGDCVHRHDSAHEGGRNTGGKTSNKDILVGDACE